MMEHLHRTEVQFRALFALINLVIPSVGWDGDTPDPLALADGSSEEMLDETVDQIVGLVVTAMKNFFVPVKQFSAAPALFCTTCLTPSADLIG
jgi:hypothetical protein